MTQSRSEHPATPHARTLEALPWLPPIFSQSSLMVTCGSRLSSERNFTRPRA